MWGFKILWVFTKGSFDILHKILNLYTAKYAWTFMFCVIYDIFELWRHKP